MGVKYIHVNQHKIRANIKTGSKDPVITVKEGKTNRYCQSVEILGPSEVIYSPDKPLLSCGARVAIRTSSEVVLHGETSPPETEDIETCPVIEVPSVEPLKPVPNTEIIEKWLS